MSSEYHFLQNTLQSYTINKNVNSLNNENEIHVSNNTQGTDFILSDTDNNGFNDTLTGFYSNEQTAYIANIDEETRKFTSACAYDEDGNLAYLFEFDDDGKCSAENIDGFGKNPKEYLKRMFSDIDIADKFEKLHQIEEQLFEDSYNNPLFE